RLVALDALVDFLAVDRDILGRGDAHAHLVALDAEHGHGDRISDHERLANPPGQNQHVRDSWPGSPPGMAWKAPGGSLPRWITQVKHHNEQPARDVYAESNGNRPASGPVSGPATGPGGPPPRTAPPPAPLPAQGRPGRLPGPC